MFGIINILQIYNLTSYSWVKVSERARPSPVFLAIKESDDTSQRHRRVGTECGSDAVLPQMYVQMLVHFHASSNHKQHEI